jgi:hypothetical protein
MKQSFAYDQTYRPAFPTLELTIIGTETSEQQTALGLIDSGSDAAPIPLSILRNISARKLDQWWVEDLSGLRFPVTIYGVQLAIGEMVLYGLEVIGRPNARELIVGRDVLNQLIVTLNGLAHVTEISD